MGGLGVPGLTYGRIPCVVSVLKPITFTSTFTQFWCSIFSLNFGDPFWSLILVLNFVAGFWRLILVLNFGARFLALNFGIWFLHSILVNFGGRFWS